MYGSNSCYACSIAFKFICVKWGVFDTEYYSLEKHFSLERVQNSYSRRFNSSCYCHCNTSPILICKLYIRYELDIPRDTLVVDASILLLMVILGY